MAGSGLFGIGGSGASAFRLSLPFAARGGRRALQDPTASSSALPPEGQASAQAAARVAIDRARERLRAGSVTLADAARALPRQAITAAAPAVLTGLAARAQ